MVKSSISFWFVSTTYCRFCRWLYILGRAYFDVLFCCQSVACFDLFAQAFPLCQVAYCTEHLLQLFNSIQLGQLAKKGSSVPLVWLTSLTGGVWVVKVTGPWIVSGYLMSQARKRAINKSTKMSVMPQRIVQLGIRSSISCTSSLRISRVRSGI